MRGRTIPLGCTAVASFMFFSGPAMAGWQFWGSGLGPSTDFAIGGGSVCVTPYSGLTHSSGGEILCQNNSGISSPNFSQFSTFPRGKAQHLAIGYSGFIYTVSDNGHFYYYQPTGTTAGWHDYNKQLPNTTAKQLAIQKATVAPNYRSCSGTECFGTEEGHSAWSNLWALGADGNAYNLLEIWFNPLVRIWINTGGPFKQIAYSPTWQLMTATKGDGSIWYWSWDGWLQLASADPTVVASTGDIMVPWYTNSQPYPQDSHGNPIPAAADFYSLVGYTMPTQMSFWDYSKDTDNQGVLVEGMPTLVQEGNADAAAPSDYLGGPHSAGKTDVLWLLTENLRIYSYEQ